MTLQYKGKKTNESIASLSAEESDVDANNSNRDFNEDHDQVNTARKSLRFNESPARCKSAAPARRSATEAVSGEKKDDTSPKRKTRPLSAVFKVENKEDAIRRVYMSPVAGDSRHGEHVIARCDEDGYYYKGIIVSCPDNVSVVVEFDSAPVNRARVSVTNLMPMSGAIPRPTLRQNDFVLVLSKNYSTGLHCYIPGMVVTCPLPGPSQPKFFGILLYSRRTITAFRFQLVRITEHKYQSTVGYITEQSRINGAKMVTSPPRPHRPMSAAMNKHRLASSTVVEERIEKMIAVSPFNTGQSLDKRSVSAKGINNSQGGGLLDEILTVEKQTDHSTSTTGTRSTPFRPATNTAEGIASPYLELSAMTHQRRPAGSARGHHKANKTNLADFLSPPHQFRAKSAKPGGNRHSSRKPDLKENGSSGGSTELNKTSERRSPSPMSGRRQIRVPVPTVRCSSPVSKIRQNSSPNRLSSSRYSLPSSTAHSKRDRCTKEKHFSPYNNRTLMTEAVLRDLKEGNTNSMREGLKKGSLKLSEGLAEIVYCKDPFLGLMVYLKINAKANVDQIVINKHVSNEERLQLLKSVLNFDASASVLLGRSLVDAGLDVDTVMDAFISNGHAKAGIDFLLTVLTGDNGSEKRLQMLLVETAFSVGRVEAEKVFALRRFTNYDRTKARRLCEEAGMFERAVEQCDDTDAVGKLMKDHAGEMKLKWLKNYFATLSENSQEIATIFREMLKNSEKLIRNKMIIFWLLEEFYSKWDTGLIFAELFGSEDSNDQAAMEDFFNRIEHVHRFNKNDIGLNTLYIQVACLAGKILAAELACRNPNFIFNGSDVCSFLTRLRRPSLYRLLMFVCDRFGLIYQLIRFLYREKPQLIEAYVTLLNPAKLPQVIKALQKVGGEDNAAVEAEINRLSLLVPDGQYNGRK